jgi:DNA-binding GntR family transcriptional regulator
MMSNSTFRTRHYEWTKDFRYLLMRIRMTDVTHILNAIEQGNAQAADKLLPLLCEEIHVLAAQKLSNEQPYQNRISLYRRNHFKYACRY